MFLMFLFCIPILSGQIIAAQIMAKGGTRPQIQYAIEMAKTGDTVKIPEGTFNFDGGITFKTGITVMGSGQDKTILQKSGNTEPYTFSIDGANGMMARISSMTIIGLNPKMSPGIKVIKGAKGFRIDHITFKNCYDRAVVVHDNSTGVIDHNIFLENELTAVVVYGDGDVSWKNPCKLGTEDAVYIEDNYFEQKNAKNPEMAHHVASNNGSKYVFRYNTMIDGYLNAQAIDVHGNKFYWPRGSRCYEIYNNKITVTHRWLGMRIRGGDGVIFNNEINGDISYPIDLMHEGRSGDGNCSYPCEDQIRELYLWGNTHNGKTFQIKVRHPSLIQENRDYFIKQKDGYKPFQYPHPLTLLDSKTPVYMKRAVTKSKNLKITGVVYRKDESVNISGYFPENNNEIHNVNIVIYDSQGRIVRRIITGYKGAGEQYFKWDGRDKNDAILAGGLYTIELRAGKMKATKALIINR